MEMLVYSVPSCPQWDGGRLLVTYMMKWQTGSGKFKQCLGQFVNEVFLTDTQDTGDLGYYDSLCVHTSIFRVLWFVQLC